jgi:hypothetical protein
MGSAVIARLVLTDKVLEHLQHQSVLACITTSYSMDLWCNLVLSWWHLILGRPVDGNFRTSPVSGKDVALIYQISIPPDITCSLLEKSSVMNSINRVKRQLTEWGKIIYKLHTSQGADHVENRSKLKSKKRT